MSEGDSNSGSRKILEYQWRDPNKLRYNRRRQVPALRSSDNPSEASFDSRTAPDSSNSGNSNVESLDDARLGMLERRADEALKAALQQHAHLPQPIREKLDGLLLGALGEIRRDWDITVGSLTGSRNAARQERPALDDKVVSESGSSRFHELYRGLKERANDVFSRAKNLYGTAKNRASGVFDPAINDLLERIRRASEYGGAYWYESAVSDADRVMQLSRQNRLGINSKTAYEGIISGLIQQIQRTSNYRGTYWYESAVSDANKAMSLNEKHNLRIKKNLIYNPIIEGLLEDLRRSVEYRSSDWYESATSSANKINRLNEQLDLGFNLSLVYKIVIDGLVEEVRSNMAHGWSRDYTLSRANKAIELAEGYAPGRVRSLVPTFKGLGLDIRERRQQEESPIRRLISAFAR